MSKYLQVVTESGTQYYLTLDEEGSVRLWYREGLLGGKSWGIKNLQADEFEPYVHGPEGEMWDYIHLRPWARRPIVGYRMYITAKREWAITTPVVSIEEVEE
jgi:hypothetical protein